MMRQRSSRPRAGFGGCLALAVALALVAADARAIFVVNQPWIAPARGGHSTEAYMDLTSTEGATLVAARADIAGSLALRAPAKRTGDVSRLPLPAGRMVSLAPGGYRLVLSGLTQAIKLGDRVILTLTIEAADGSRQDVPVNAEARLHSPLDDERRGHEHKH